MITFTLCTFKYTPNQICLKYTVLCDLREKKMENAHCDAK